jgi:putative N6-adenine-specific DNA methylase
LRTHKQEAEGKAKARVMRLVAICPDEIKDVIAAELAEIGITDVLPGYRAVYFTADETQFYRCHLRLRSANAILLRLDEFPFKDAIDLQRKAQRIHFHQLFDAKKTFIVDAIQGDRGDRFLTTNAISKAVRLAIENVFKNTGNPIPKVDLTEPDVRIVAFVRQGKCSISVDTSGKSMHKRGYRALPHPAPIKETLAAAVLRLAGYNGKETLYDPMCGSGTIAIEAAGIALNKAALIHRKRGEFGFEQLKLFNSQLWRDIQDQARLEKAAAPAAPIFASDISSQFVKDARENALRARVERNITFSTGDFLELPAPAETGILVANLPYGDRLGSKEALAEFYTKIGNTLKQRYRGWRVVLLTAEDAPHKLIGLKPSKKLSILNGSIECKLLWFDIFAGSHREHKIERSKLERPNAERVQDARVEI